MNAEEVTAVGIDTSDKVASIALQVGHQVHSRTLERTGRRHARTLVPELKQLLRENAVEPSAVQVVGVTLGPGSFTGLRVGVACAKSFAWACQTAVVGVSTFDVLAAQVPDDERPVWLAMNAERGQLFVKQTGTDQPSFELVDEVAWIAGLDPSERVCGPLPTKTRDAVTKRCHVLDESVGIPSAATVITIAANQFVGGEIDDAYQLVPQYGRLSAAEEKALADP